MPPHNGSENCLAIGTHLVDFEITGILGEGGFGVVYVAFDHSLQRTVAIKEYMPGSLSWRSPDGNVIARTERDKEAFEAGLRSFINEARLLAQFDHPSLVKVYRFWEQNQTAYMAMRYYDGQTLQNIVRERPEIVTEAWLKFIFKQILEALDTLYRAKILHRDVSPDNIIVQKNGDAVLLDFGSARQIIGDMTQGLTVILKPGYAPMEQYSAEAEMAQGPWTDIYALAAVMYFAIVKTPPITSVTRMIKDSLMLLQDGSHVGFSYKFLVAIDKGLALQPEDRPQTMDEFRRLLGIAAFSSGRSSRSSRSSRRSRSESSGSGSISGSVSGSVSAAIETNAEGSADGSVEGAKEIEPSPKIASHPKTISRSRRSGQTQAPTSTKKVKKWQRWFGLGLGVLLLSTGAWYGLKRNQEPPKLTDPGNASSSVSISTKPSVSKPDNKGTDVLSAEPIPVSPSVKAEPEITAVFSARLRITVKPWGEIYINNKLAGISPPLKTLMVPEGKHKIRISNSAFPDIIREIEVIKGRKRLEPIEIDFVTPPK